VEASDFVRVYGAAHTGSKVLAGVNYENQRVIQLSFESGSHNTIVVVDRATAARLINQLRRVLDEDYNRAINERPETDASKDYSGN
jgi:hypothetical protein